MSLVGAILLGGAEMFNIRALKPAEFYDQRHRWAWEAMLVLVQQDAGIDIITFEDQLVRMGHDRNPAYWSDCIALCPTPFHAADYAKIVKGFAARRQAIDDAGKKAGEAWEGKADKHPGLYDSLDDWS